MEQQDEWENSIPVTKEFLKRKYRALLHERYARLGIPEWRPVNSATIQQLRAFIEEPIGNELFILDRRKTPETEYELTVDQAKKMLALYRTLIDVRNLLIQYS